MPSNADVWDAGIRIKGGDAFNIDGGTASSSSVLLPVGAKYNATATTYSDGKLSMLQSDVNGNLKSTLATAIAGEDLTNDVLKVENRYSYGVLTSASTIAIKSGAGFVHAVGVGTLSCPTTTFWDSTTPSGTPIFRLGAGAPIGTYVLDVSFATGLVADAGAGGVAPFIFLSYR